MKTSLLIFIFIASSLLYSQNTIRQIDKKLDSLQTAKLNTEQRIAAYQEQLKQINKEITELQNKKKQLLAIEMGDVIMAKIAEGGAVLRDKPSSLGVSICNIPPNSPIKVFKEQENLYFKVDYNGQIGYVNYSTIAHNQEIDDFLSGKTTKPISKSTSQTTIIRSIDEADPRYQKLQKLYGKEIAIRIMNNELWEGMSMGQTIESIGKPQNKTSVNTNEGIKEVWEYPQYMLEFFNGSLSKIIKR